jgi:hypothetical protein
LDVTLPCKAAVKPLATRPLEISFASFKEGFGTCAPNHKRPLRHI